MILTQDMKEFIALLEKYQVEYVIVGGFAVNYYGYIRTTQDIDMLIFPSYLHQIKEKQPKEPFGLQWSFTC